MLRRSILFLLFLPLSLQSPNATCLYDLDTATRLIPPACYANATTPYATSCCWYVFAAYIYAVIKYSNITGAAFLPPDTASACSSAFSSYLLHRRLVRPSLLHSSDCSLSEDPSLSASSRPCQFPSVSAVKSAVNLSSAVTSCISPDLDLDSNCVTCRDAVIAATFSLFGATNSKQFVPCGMAATIGIWSGYTPSVPRFRSYALCMLQTLENIGGLNSANLIPSPPAPPPLTPLSSRFRSRSRTIKIAAASAVAVLISIAATVWLALAIKKRRRLEDQDQEAPGPVTGSPLPTDGLYIFTKTELKQATNGYSDRLLLGEGGAGKVYLGKLPSGQHVAIKRIYRKKKLGEFYREVEILAKLRHRKLTTLVGYCIGSKEHVLVYEYMGGGNLSRALYHGDLTWHRRVRIAADVAEGLVYLHEFPDGAVVHRDVKPTNVLLTDGGLAKLSDFGVSRILPMEGSHVSTEIRGTLGYVDPESFSAGHVSESADVYSFGVVLLELVTGLKAVVPTPSGGAESVVQVARDVAAEGEDWTSIVDPKLGSEWDRGSVREVFELASMCVRPFKNERPRMAEVLGVLKGVLLDLEAKMDSGLGHVSSSGPSTEEGSEGILSTPSVHAWSL